MKFMTYKGYKAEISYSDEDECFVGHVVNIDSMVSFHGNTDDELRTAFQEMNFGETTLKMLKQVSHSRPKGAGF